MSGNRTVLVFLSGFVVLFLTVQLAGYGFAGPGDSGVQCRIGVVSIRRVFGECKRNVEYREKANAEQAGIMTELEKLSSDIESEKAGLKALKEGSSDYLEAMRRILNKQANLQAMQQFHKQQIDIQDKRFSERLYQDILRATGEVARDRGLDMVFDKDEAQLPSPSANELMMTIRTHKLLYSEGCIDITDQVLARLDAAESVPAGK